jgi:hypothetical protein
MLPNDWVDKIPLAKGRYHQYCISQKRFYLFDKDGMILGSRKTLAEIEQYNREV